MASLSAPFLLGRERLEAFVWRGGGKINGKTGKVGVEEKAKELVKGGGGRLP